jgi:L-ascorbate metabolism protein UlaG (beta-lactamase superfamily)
MRKLVAAITVMLVAPLAALLAGQAAPQARPLLSVTYLGNEGVYIESGGVGILFDAPHRAGVPGYEAIPAETLARIESAQPPYDGVSLILVTHCHSDHFDAGSVARHLARNAKAIFIGAQETADAVLGAAGDAAIRSRVKAVTPAMGRSELVPAGAARVRVLRLAHGGTQNVGHLVEVNGWKALHVGDSDGTAANFAPFALAKEKIDVAFVPYWYALDEESRRVVREQIAAARVVFFHIPKENPEDAGLQKHLDDYGGRAGMVKKMAEDFPQAIFLTRPLETHRW